jgi:F-type H+-transporting ATPase subunit delta
VAGEDTTVSGMAGRYANALFELARQENAVDQVGGDLQRFEGLARDSQDLARLIRSPAFSSEEQGRAIAAVLEKTGIGGIAGNFIKLVAANRRLFAVNDMIRGFRALVAKNRGEVTAQVTAAENLSDTHVASLKEALNQVTGKEVALEVKIDPAIIGGLVVKIGSRMVDTSLRSKLNAMKIAMKEAR